MLLHIRPQLFFPYREAVLIDLDIEPIGLHLRGGEDLMTGRPYPNKQIKVACRKDGRKARDGILIELVDDLDRLNYTARWAILASFSVKHMVEYRILDHDFDAASDDMILWHASSQELGGWSSRWPSEYEEDAHVPRQPLMEVFTREGGRPRKSEDTIQDGWIVSRREVFCMPTIERDRILKRKFHDRMPLLESAFRV